MLKLIDLKKALILHNWISHLKKGCIFTALVAALAGPASAASGDEMPWRCYTPPGGPPCNNDYWPNYQTAASNLKQLYTMESFKALERALKELIASGKNFPAGEPMATAPYMAFRLAMPAPGTSPQEEERIKRWKTAVPNSYFAVFAEARYQYASAWEARGTSGPNSISPEAWELYDSRLAAAQKILDNAPTELKATPMWDMLTLAIALDSRSPNANIAATLKNAVKRWPRDFYLYKNTLDSIAQSEGGTWEVIDAFINYWSEQQKTTEGSSMYARLYIHRNWALASGSKVNWPRMKASLEDLIARYPDPYFKNVYPSYACAKRDKPAFAKAINKLPKEELNTSYWAAGRTHEACLQWASKK
jgi:hypothetical protein